MTLPTDGFGRVLVLLMFAWLVYLSVRAADCLELVPQAGGS